MALRAEPPFAGQSCRSREEASCGGGWRTENARKLRGQKKNEASSGEAHEKGDDSRDPQLGRLLRTPGVNALSNTTPGNKRVSPGQQRQRGQGRALLLYHLLGTQAASERSHRVAGPDAVPGAPCRWGGQGISVPGAGDRRWPARQPRSAQTLGGQRMRRGGTREPRTL